MGVERYRQMRELAKATGSGATYYDSVVMARVYHEWLTMLWKEGKLPPEFEEQAKTMMEEADPAQGRSRV